MSTAGVSGLLWNARTLAIPPFAEAGAAKARTKAAARIAPTRARSLAKTTSCNAGLGSTRSSGRPGDRLQKIAGRLGPWEWPRPWSGVNRVAGAVLLRDV